LSAPHEAAGERPLPRAAGRSSLAATLACLVLAIVSAPAAAGIHVDGAASIARETIDIVFEKNGSIVVEHRLAVRPERNGAVTFSALEHAWTSKRAFETGVVRGGVETPLAPEAEASRSAVAGFETVCDSRLHIVRCPRVEPGALVTYRRVERHEWPLALGAIPFDRDVPIDSIVVTARAREGAALRWLLANARGIAGPLRGEAAGETSVVWVSGPREVAPKEPLAPIDAGSALHLLPAGVAAKRGAPAGSWADIGQWWTDLIAGSFERDRRARDERARFAAAPDAAIAASDRVYATMQSKFRYVAIELGIGGWVPDRARDVIERGYGDCKELSVAMVSMLEAEGVTAQLALVRSGLHAPLDATFPSPGWFNHAIVAVPDARGAYRFYDPTDAAARPGSLPWQDFGSAVLVVGGAAGGELVELPETARESTSVWIELECRVESDEATRVTARVRATGYEAQRARALAEHAPGAAARDGLALFRAAWIDEAFVERSELVKALPSVVDIDSVVVAGEYVLWRGARALSGGRRAIDAATLPTGRHFDGLERPSPRTQPVRLAYPITIHQRVRVYAAPGAAIEAGADAAAIARDGYRFAQAARADSSGLLTITREFELRRIWFDTESASALARDWAEIAAAAAPVVIGVPAR